MLRQFVRNILLPTHRATTLCLLAGSVVSGSALIAQSFPQPASFSSGANGSGPGYSAAVLNGQVWIAGANQSNSSILLTHSPNGYSLPPMTTPQALVRESALAISMTSYNGSLYMAYRGNFAGTKVAQSSDGVNWNVSVVLAGGSVETNSNLAPAIAVYGGKLVVCAVDQSNGYAYLTSSTDGRTWSARTLVGTYVAGQQPSMAVTSIGGRLALVVALVGSDKHLWLGSTYDGVNFTDSAAYEQILVNPTTTAAILGFRGSGILLHYISNDKYRVVLQATGATVYDFGGSSTSVTYKNLASGTSPSLQTLSVPSVNGGAPTAYEIFGSNDPQLTIGTTSTE